MSSSFPKEQESEILSSLRRYFSENLDCELSEMRAGFLLEYLMSEIGPFAYNKGVEDARKYFAAMTEDLPGTCFQEPMAYWKNHRAAARGIRRKPDL